MLLFPGANEPIYNEHECMCEDMEDDEEIYEGLVTNSSFPDTNGDDTSRVTTLPQPDENTCKPLTVDLTSVSIQVVIDRRSLKSIYFRMAGT